jgi:hypothetical protein
MNQLNKIFLYIKVYSGRAWTSFRFAQYITIFRKKEDNYVFRIDLRFPEIGVFTYKTVRKIFEDNSPDERGIKFPTEIWFTDSNSYWIFDFKIAGFGFSIYKHEKIK